MYKMVPEYQFPEAYYENYLVLLVRDPNCIYAYWELGPQVRRQLKQQFERNGEQHFHLRVVDSTGLEDETNSPHTFKDFEVHPMADNYFIKDLEANRSYRVELGTLDDGGFRTLLRSNTVHTPRNSIAENSPLMVKQIFAAEDVNDRDVNSRDVNGKDILIGSFAEKGIYGDSMA